jgi:hypothetical protein
MAVNQMIVNKLNEEIGDHVGHIYLIELEINDTTYTARSASYLGLYINIDSEG